VGSSITHPPLLSKNPSKPIARTFHQVLSLCIFFATQRTTPAPTPSVILEVGVWDGWGWVVEVETGSYHIGPGGGSDPEIHILSTHI
jgi:hypothetical protein